MIERSGNNNKDPLHGVKLVEILNFLEWDLDLNELIQMPEEEIIPMITQCQ